MMIMRRLLNVICAAMVGICCVFVPAWAEEKAIEFPSPSGYINDFAGIISASDYQKLTALTGALEQKTTAEVVVVTLKSIAPYDVQDYSVRLFEKWKIGKSGKDNGALLLVAVEDRALWITTGYGLEGAIPDAEAGRIYRQVITPYFKQGKFSQGVVAGTVALVDLAAKEYNVNIEELPALVEEYAPLRKSAFLEFFNGLITLLIFIFIFGVRFGLFSFLLLGPGRRRGYWSGGGFSGGGGGFGGGFGGFGGGSTGGGGAGGRW
ncbi:MAG: TPM domain-containing protein [Candidatus Omnitrophota bacterium]